MLCSIMYPVGNTSTLCGVFRASISASRLSEYWVEKSLEGVGCMVYGVFFELIKNDEPTTAMLSAHAASSVNN